MSAPSGAGVLRGLAAELGAPPMTARELAEYADCSVDQAREQACTAELLGLAERVDARPWSWRLTPRGLEHAIRKGLCP